MRSANTQENSDTDVKNTHHSRDHCPPHDEFGVDGLNSSCAAARFVRLGFEFIYRQALKKFSVHVKSCASVSCILTRQHFLLSNSPHTWSVFPSASKIVGTVRLGLSLPCRDHRIPHTCCELCRNSNPRSQHSTAWLFFCNDMRSTGLYPSEFCNSRLVG